MTEVQLVHTAHVDAAVLASARTLLEDAFAGRFSEDDWEHCLGGWHALARDEGRLVGHGSVVQRRLLHGGRALRVGYVEGVAVAAGHRRRGHAGELMAVLEDVVRRAYDAGALSASARGAPLYDARGWAVWRGPTSALTPAGVVRTPGDDGLVRVLPVTADLDLDGEITCNWRDGDVW